jgi:hypothetical protein
VRMKKRRGTSRFSELIAEQSSGSLLLVWRTRSGRKDMRKRGAADYEWVVDGV